MKIIIILLTVCFWPCLALEPSSNEESSIQESTRVCVDLGAEFGNQTLQVSEEKFKWITKRGAIPGRCQPNQITNSLTEEQMVTRQFCKRFKPRGQRHAFSTIEAPKAATDWLLDRHAELGKCRRRHVGPAMKMEYIEPDTFVTVKIRTDSNGADISWNLNALSSGDEISSSGGVVYGNNETYEVQLYLDNGDYNFTIYDSVGDGLDGEGYYAIYDEDGKEILHNGRPGPFEAISHVIRIGYQPWEDMTGRDKLWLKAHNERRQAFHEINNKSYVPLMWSNDLKDLANECLEHILQDCGVQDLHAEPDIDEGENVFGEQGAGALNQLDPPEEVLMHWVDQKEEQGAEYPENNALTQVYWRATRFLGCMSGSRAYPDNRYCERHVCIYVTAGNCAMATFNATVDDNWKIPTLEKYSNCGYLCPSDGCYVSDFDGIE